MSSDAVFSSTRNYVSSSDYISIPPGRTTMDTETIAMPFSIPYQSINGGPSLVRQPQDSGDEFKLQEFWNQQHQHLLGLTGDQLRSHSLPLARIKKIMKSDEDVRMISAEAPVLFSKACEIFITELTHRAWNHASVNKRRTIQRSDIAAAIASTDVFDFLVDIVPREKLEQFMDRQTTDTGPPETNGVFPVLQPDFFNTQMPTGMELPHPEQQFFLPHYFQFKRH
eukprot:g695.t1